MYQLELFQGIARKPEGPGIHRLRAEVIFQVRAESRQDAFNIIHSMIPWGYVDYLYWLSEQVDEDDKEC